MSKHSKTFLSVVAVILLWTSYLGFSAVYVFSVYEAIMLNGWKGIFVAIPVFGQMLWAGVKFYSTGFFNTFFYLVIASLVLFGLASLIALFTSEEEKD